MGGKTVNERTAAKYYPETDETPKGHLNQTRKNVRSTKTRKKRGWDKAARDAVVSKAKEKNGQLGLNHLQTRCDSRKGKFGF